MSRKDLQLLGTRRESLYHNPLLIQSEVGKIRRRCFTLPPSDFTYGMETVAIDGGVSEALSCWKYHKPSHFSKTKQPERDFVALNKAAIQSGLTTAQEQQNYRATHDIRKSVVSATIKKAPKIPDNMVFGISTRPSTPLYDLLENRYQERWLTDKREAERQERVKVVSRKGKVYETRASLLRRYSEPVDPPPYWKMRRWSKIPGELETFRSDKARSEAFHHHASDSTSRMGLYGQGIYQAAKS